MPALDHSRLAGGLLLAALLLAAEYWAKEPFAGMLPHARAAAASRREGAAYRRARVWRAAVLAVWLALAFRPGWWLPGCVALPWREALNSLFGGSRFWLRSHSRRTLVGRNAGFALCPAAADPCCSCWARCSDESVGHVRSGRVEHGVWRAVGAVFSSDAADPAQLAAVSPRSSPSGPSNHMSGACWQGHRPYPTGRTTRTRSSYCQGGACHRPAGKVDNGHLHALVSTAPWALRDGKIDRQVLQKRRTRHSPSITCWARSYSMLLALLSGWRLRWCCHDSPSLVRCSQDGHSQLEADPRS